MQKTFNLPEETFSLFDVALATKAKSKFADTNDKFAIGISKFAIRIGKFAF
jgi:hypothetical protein